MRIIFYQSARRMSNLYLNRFFCNLYYIRHFLEKKESHWRLKYNTFNRCLSHLSKGDAGGENGMKVSDEHQVPSVTGIERNVGSNSRISKYSSDDEDLSDSKWKVELAWLTKALGPALQLYKWALPTGNESGNRTPSYSRSLSEIISHIQRNKIGIQDWSLSDLTIGLYLIYLRQASSNPFEDVKGVQITSEPIVQDLIYHTELAKGAYKDNVVALARHSMLQASNTLKFVKESSVMRPGYYIGIDPRKKLVILGIRGTHTVYDLITDIVSSSDEEITFEGYSTHFGTAEAARWFLRHEIATIKKCLEKYEGYRLRLVGHSLGGATASLLAIMLRKSSSKELGFSPKIVSAIGYATPPCVSKELAEQCSDFVTTVVMQDDIIPRLSVASLTRLRREIVETDWMSVVEKEDWKSVIDLVTNAKQVVSSVQDVARKVADYAKFRSKKNSSDILVEHESNATLGTSSTSKPAIQNYLMTKQDGATCKMPEELFVPGSVYYLKRNMNSNPSIDSNMPKTGEFFTLWKRQPGEHFQRIVLSSNLISDHKCDSHYYALRDVLKGLPGSSDDTIF